MKTEAITITTATSAPLICSMAMIVASLTDLCSLAMIRSTFSTTTMASSTTIPMASTRPKSVRRLMEKPSAIMPAKVPINETMMATIQMIVERKLCRKK